MRNNPWPCRVILSAFYLTVAMCGVGDGARLSGGLFVTIQPTVSTLLLGWWVVADAIRRGRPIPLLSRDWMVMFAGIAMPGYLIWTRGWRGLWLLLLNIVGLVVVMACATTAATELVAGK